MMASPTSTRSRRRGRLSSSTTPTPVADMSYSCGRSTPGCSAVSPPSSEQPAVRQPSAMPAAIAATLLRHDLAAGDVVQQEQRLGAAGHQVVDDHRDKVDADRVVDVHLLRDDAAWCRRRRSTRRAAGCWYLLQVQPEQSGEAADVADDLRPPGAVHLGLQQLHRLVAGVDGDSRVGVGDRTAVACASGPALS